MSYSYYRLYYHLIWGTKNRLPLITPENEKLLIAYFPKKVNEYGGQQIEFNMTEDHIHWLGTIPPKISIAEFVHNLKGSVSYYINMRSGEKSFYWQANYGVLSLSGKGIPIVRGYIARQKERRAKNDLIDVLEYIPKDDK